MEEEGEQVDRQKEKHLEEEAEEEKKRELMAEGRNRGSERCISMEKAQLVDFKATGQLACRGNERNKFIICLV